jgi:hypothetical protein
MGRRKGNRKVSKKLKGLQKKKRSQRDLQEAKFAIEQSINRQVELEPDTMANLGRQYRVAENDKAVINGPVENAMMIESPKVKAFRFKEGLYKKLIIEDISRSADAEFGILDTIHTFIGKAGFADAAHLEVFLTANSEKEIESLSDYLDALDPDLFRKVTFINKNAGAGVVVAEADDSDDNDSTTGDNAPGKLLQRDPVMNGEFLSHLMGQDPKKGSDKYLAVLGVLKEYHDQLDRFKLDMVNDGDSSKLFEKHVAALNTIISRAIPIVDTYISDSRSKKLLVTSKKVGKKDAMKVLRTQLTNINAFNSNADLERLRKEYWVQVLSPLTDIHVDPSADGFVVGAAAQGEVTLKSVTFKGPPPFVAAVKIDNLEKWNQEAVNSGIPIDNPEQSKRSVSAYLMNKYLKMNVLPDTRFVVRTNPETGKQEFGQAIEFVRGQIGQMNGIDKREVDPAKAKLLQEYKEKVEAGEPEPPPPGEDRNAYLRERDLYRNAVDELKKVAFIQGKYHAFTNKPPDIDYRSPVVQKELADLQLLDNIIGHADRHGENIIFQFGADGSIIGLKGIDNDDTFGGDWKAKTPGDKQSSKTPGFPPVIDLDTALNIFRLSPDNILSDLQKGLENKLPEDGIGNAITRLIKAQGKIRTMLENGEMQIASGLETADPSKVLELEKIGRLTPGRLNGKVLQWGENTFDAHISKETVQVEINVGSGVYRTDILENSYLGTMLTLGETRGFEKLPDE